MPRDPVEAEFDEFNTWARWVAEDRDGDSTWLAAGENPVAEES